MRLAVLGWPIEHSRSPQLHLAAYAALGLDWGYERIRVEEDGLEGLLERSGRSWRGFSVTMPLKRRALELAEDVDRLAELTGSVNTLLRAGADSGTGSGAGWRGFNTDVAGLVAAIGETERPRPRSVLILGGGATATSAVVAAAELGARDVHVAVRTPARAAELLPLAASVGLTATIGTLDALEGRAADLVIATLPGGAVIDHDIPAALREAALLFDVAYDPWPSALAHHWMAAGGQAVSGIGMLLHQALVQVRIFVNGDPLAPLPDEGAVLAAMRTAVAGP